MVCSGKRWGAARERTAVVSALSVVLVVTGGAGPAAAGAVRGSVPSPTAGTSVVTVKTGGDRTGTTSVAPLPGVRLGLFADAAAATPVDPVWAVCTADAAGDCSFVVPGTGSSGAQAGARFYVKQLAAPAGWYTNPDLRTGPGNGSGSVTTPYQFQTPPMVGGATYASTSDFMVSDVQVDDASTGIWQQSRVNPALKQGCGLDVALILDLSASVGSALPSLKKAADTFTDALAGTPSRMALFTFDKGSPSTATSNFPALVSVSTTAGATAFKNRYATWKLGAGTNWDRGIWAPAQAAPHYDLAVVLTDGNPTYYDKVRGGDGTNTRLREVENGIYSANALKAKNTRVLAVGVGKGVTGSTALNLRAISGTTAYDGSNTAAADYYQTSDYDAAGQAMHDLVLAHCKGSLSIVKQLVPGNTFGENVTGSAPAGAGWAFTATTSTPGVTVPRSTHTTTGDGTGSVNFDIGFTGATTSAQLTLTETQHSGYDLVTQGGKNAVCIDLDDGSPIPVTNTGTGITLTATADTSISCTLYNRPTRRPPPVRPLPNAAHLTLVKRVKGGPAKPSAWTLTARGPSTITGTTARPAVTRKAVRPGTYHLTESSGPTRYRPSAWTCTNRGAPLPVRHGNVTLTTGADVTCVITNTFNKRRTDTTNKHPEGKLRVPGGPLCRLAISAASCWFGNPA